MSEALAEKKERWGLPLLLFVATFLSTLYAGAEMEAAHGQSVDTISELLAGWVFAVPLMTILLAHELGHYVAGRRHGIDISPPYFIPMPFLLGTMGAVIRMRDQIRSRDALLDVGAAGPIAGMVFAVPILVYGIATSKIELLADPDTKDYLMEGRSIFYLALIWIVHGPIPEGHDIILTSTAFAGWAGLLVTMINLMPVGQLDGGHVAYALLGPKQDLWSERFRRALPLLAVVVGLAYGIPSYLQGQRGHPLLFDFLAGAQWLVWAGVLWAVRSMSGPTHPPTSPGPLSARRRLVAIATLTLFALLFMPSWLRQQ